MPFCSLWISVWHTCPFKWELSLDADWIAATHSLEGHLKSQFNGQSGWCNIKKLLCLQASRHLHLLNFTDVSHFHSALLLQFTVVEINPKVKSNSYIFKWCIPIPSAPRNTLLSEVRQVPISVSLSCFLRHDKETYFRQQILLQANLV